MSAPASPSAPPRLFDPRRRAARLARAARRFAGADFLHRRAAEHMAQDLEFILRDFPVAVDVSAHPGLFEAVAREEGVARLGAVAVIEDPAVRAQPASAPLPVADGSADLIVSVLSLHWSDDLPGALAQIRRALKPDGLFLGALFGGTTLNELRGVLTEAELEITGGAQARVSPFADGFDGAALLQRAGFALPAVDVDRITVRYPDLPALVRDLRAMGETSALAGPARPVRRDVLARAAAALRRPPRRPGRPHPRNLRDHPPDRLGPSRQPAETGAPRLRHRAPGRRPQHPRDHGRGMTSGLQDQRAAGAAPAARRSDDQCPLRFVTLPNVRSSAVVNFPSAPEAAWSMVSDWSETETGSCPAGRASIWQRMSGPLFRSPFSSPT